MQSWSSGPGKSGTVKGMLRRLLLILLTASALTSCSNTTQAKSSVTSEPPLCRSVSSLDTLNVTRTDALPQNHMRFTFPAQVTVSNQTQVQTIARALCALPQRKSHVSINCPADFGIRYSLTFFGNGKAFPEIRLDPSGCSFVQGLKKDQWVEQSPGFWHTLGAAMGITGANNSTFRGRGPNVG